MSLQCSSCKSENVQKVSLVYESGISAITGKSTSTGVGMSRGGLGVGVARSKIKGSQQTELSRKAAPPAKKRFLRNLIIYTVGFLFIPAIIISTLHIGNENMQMVVGFGYMALAAYHLYKNFMFNKKTWPSLYNIWNRQYMCLTCGNTFETEVAAEIAEAQNDVVLDSVQA